jgi:hypothetical protein
VHMVQEEKDEVLNMELVDRHDQVKERGEAE